MRRIRKQANAFTLVELLVVIGIIAILMGLLFAGGRAVQQQAKRTQAKNDLAQIVTAVNAFYTEYGKYPLVTADTIYGTGGTSSADLFYALRAVALGANASNAINPRQIVFKIVFISPPYVKDPGTPVSGIGTVTGARQYYDPWGMPYAIEVDGNYNNQIDINPYTANAGPSPLQAGVIAWSLGSDHLKGSDLAASDDVISWQ
ncbi:MAG: hypothetical protein DMF25_05770 [Verrucomicrobia bacterium]|nr:MAG: hypothetical protein DMF25_05770 [Verrucomicrobiota bacterium]